MILLIAHEDELKIRFRGEKNDGKNIFIDFSVRAVKQNTGIYHINFHNVCQ
jgi:hypothetical protein